MKHLAHSLTWYFYWCSALFLGIAAVLLIGFKLLFENIDHFQAPIQDYLSKQLQAEVRFSELRGHWNGWRPQLSLKGLVVDKVEPQPNLELGLLEAQLEIDLAQTLLQLTPVFSIFDLHGFKVNYDLSQRPQVQPEVPVTKQPTTQPLSSNSSSETDTGAKLLALLLQQSHINLTRAEINLISTSGEKLSLTPIKIQVQHDGLMHQLQIFSDLKTASGTTKLKFVAEVEGKPSQDDVDFYFSISEFTHELLKPWLKLADIELQQFEGSQQVWGKIQHGKLTYLNAETQVKRFKYEQYEFENLAIHTALLRKDRGFQLQLKDLQISGAQQQLKLPKISFNFVRNGGAIEPERLMFDQLDLAVLQNWLVQQPFLEEDIAQIIRTLAPQGRLENVRIQWANPAQWESFQLMADLTQMGINAWNDVPEIKGVKGLIKADIQGGEIHLLSDDFTFAVPTLFTDKWHYSSAKGVVGWRIENKGVVLTSQLLNLADQYLSAAGRFSMYLPYDRDEQPLLNLQIGLHGADGQQARYYLPPNELGEKTHEWLIQAIKSGHIKQAGFVLNGVTRARLDDYQLPAVQAFFDLTQVSFAYQPGWPAINNGDAFLFFRNGELLAEVQGGNLYGSQIKHAWVYLPKTADKLFINGQVDGPSADIQKFLTQTPLKQEIGNELDDWQMLGRNETHLNLEIPLFTQKIPKVLVRSKISSGEFTSQKDRIEFSAINGVISYRSGSGLSAKNLKARLFGHPLKADITSSQDKTQIYINNTITADRLRQWLGLDFLQIAKGTMNYQARLDMCPQKRCNQLVINSDLKGVEINAPAPLGKTSGQEMKLLLVSDLGRGFNDGRSAVRFNLAEQLRGVMITQGQTLERARFSLGGDYPKAPEKPGIWLDGQLDYLDIEELQQFMAQAGFSHETSASAAQGNPESSLKSVDLQVERVSVAGIELQQLNAKIQPLAEGWKLQLNSPQLAGSLFIPDDSSSAYVADLDYLKITTSEAESEDEAEATQTNLKAQDLPTLDFKVKAFSLNEKTMGQWGFNLSPTEDGAKIDNIKGALYTTQVVGKAYWDVGSDQKSRLNLELKGDDFGKVLEAWGVSESLYAESLTSFLGLSWPGAPWDFVIAKTNGEVRFSAKNGRILDVGQGGGLLKIFGILNFKAIGRRLRLDFTDIFESGVAFDEVTADYNIRQGIAHTTKPFTMVGPSINLAMQGSLDLDKETVDQEIEIVIPITDNIPLVSVLLGAPQIAGAVFLFDQLIGDPLAKFSTIKYSMSGDWSEPEVKLQSTDANRNNSEDKQ